MVELFRNRKWDLVGLRNWWFAISLVTIIAGISFLIINDIHDGQPLKLGIDFTAGGQLTYKVDRSFSSSEVAPALAAIRDDVSKAGIEAEIQIAGPAIGDRNQVLFRTKTVATEAGAMNTEVHDQGRKLLELLGRRYPGATLLSTDMVGPLISRELVTNAVLAVIAGMALVLLWIMIRYDIKFATTAIIALAHDVLVVVGAFAILHREINSPFVAVVLTVVGFSVHDTVVIFDRIRENLKLRKGATFAETTNISLLETMARSVNTVLTVLITVLCLYFLGGATLRDFALGLMIGITSGAYSSIFNASQLLVVWKQREERGRRPAGARIAARSAAPSAPPPRAPAPQALGQEGESPVAVGAGQPSDDADTRGKAKPKKKAAKRKRRY